jgi:hypothetical protein
MKKMMLQSNTTPNVTGFNERMAQGKTADRNLVVQLKQSAFTASSPLDIVCHSMGFAYALGMLETIKEEGIHLGGLSVGEPAEVMYEMIEVVNSILPTDKPRYLMGVGTPVNLLKGISRGIMFDCVMRLILKKIPLQSTVLQ